MLLKFSYTRDTLKYCNDKRRQVRFGPFSKMSTIQSKEKWKSQALDPWKFYLQICPWQQCEKISQYTVVSVVPRIKMKKGTFMYVWNIFEGYNI